MLEAINRCIYILSQLPSSAYGPLSLFNSACGLDSPTLCQSTASVSLGLWHSSHVFLLELSFLGINVLGLWRNYAFICNIHLYQILLKTLLRSRGYTYTYFGHYKPVPENVDYAANTRIQLRTEGMYCGFKYQGVG